MPAPRRPARRPSRRGPVPIPEPPSDAELAAQVDEGLLIVRATLRLRMRNRLVLEAMRERVAYDEERLVAALHDDVRQLVVERRASAVRLERERARAARRRGSAEHGADYRQRDVAPLTSRIRIEALLAERLEASIADPQDALDIVRAARSSALEDVVDSSLRLLREPVGEADDGHDDRLSELRAHLRLLALDADEAAAMP